MSVVSDQKFAIHKAATLNAIDMLQAAKTLQALCKTYLANQLPQERLSDAKYAAGDLGDLQIGLRSPGEYSSHLQAFRAVSKCLQDACLALNPSWDL